MASARESAPNSQSSSFDDNQGSQYRPVSSDSFSSSQIRLPRETTPATSLSNPSSQEHMAEREQRTQRVPYSPRAPTKLDTRFGQAPVANMGRPHQEHISAPKRSADGQIKEPTPTSPTSPGYGNGRYEHSRTSSTTSRGSQVGEVCLKLHVCLHQLTRFLQLTSQLKTRLAYAAVKVQNGWETQNINELENQLRSIQASPVSTASTLRRGPYESPRPGSSSTHPGFMQSSERSTATATPEHAPHHHVGTAGLDYAYPQQPTSATQSPPSANSGRTYESFWREHSHSHPELLSGSSSRASQISTFSPSMTATAKLAPAPSLAPPVDITPRATARRTNASSSHHHHPPRLLSAASTASTSNAALALASMPATPPPPTGPPKTAMETDAIETLMCMSSPKNSTYHIPSSSQPLSSQPSPLRQHIDAAMVIGGRGRVDGLGSGGGSGGTGGGRGGQNLKTDADIERMMDQIGGESSESSDDDEVGDVLGRRRPGTTLRA